MSVLSTFPFHLQRIHYFVRGHNRHMINLSG